MHRRSGNIFYKVRDPDDLEVKDDLPFELLDYLQGIQQLFLYFLHGGRGVKKVFRFPEEEGMH